MLDIVQHRQYPLGLIGDLPGVSRLFTYEKWAGRDLLLAWIGLSQPTRRRRHDPADIGKRLSAYSGARTGHAGVGAGRVFR